MFDVTTGGTWSSTSTPIATIGLTSGIVTGVTGGIVNVVYILATGCMRSVTIDVITLPAPISGTGEVCIGSIETLSDAASGGTWTSPLSASGIATINSTTGVVSGISLGTVPVTYSLGGTCTAYKTITVNPLPDTITGSGILCTSSLITLSDATTGGTWSSSNTAIATVDLTSGIVSGVSPGSTTITYTSLAGCTTTKPITIIAGLPPITGITHVCMGLNTNLSDVMTGGVWNSSNTSVAPVAGGIVNGLAPGTATISYTTSGCPATVIVTVNPLPGPIVGGPHICLRLPYPFSDTAIGGTWTTTTTASATVGLGSGIVTGLMTGAATIVYTLPTGCTINTSVIIDTVPPGIMGINHICVGQTTILTDTLPGGTWSSNSPGFAPVVPLSPGTSAIVSGLSEGIANISYMQGGCPAIAIIVVNPVPLPILGVSNICAYGGTLHVSDSTPSGFWTSALASVSGTGDVTAFASGTAMITYTLSTGCKTTDTFTIYPLPGPITGIPNLCIGTTSLLSDTSSSGLWSSSNTAIASIGAGTGLVTGLTPGVASIIYTFTATGCRSSVNVTVYPHPSPISGIASICNGSTTTLSDLITGGAWNSANVSLATVDVGGGIVTGTSAGSVTITYTLAASCFATRSVTVLPLPAMHLVTGGGSYCDGGAGVHIGLNGSSAGIKYHLYDGASLADSASGTGTVIDFGLQTTPGTYTATAANVTTGCSNNMTGIATITITPVVIPFIGVTPGPNDTVCAGTPVTFTATSANGGSSPVYQWTVNGAATGTGTTVYTFTPVNNDTVRIMLASSAVCAIPDTVRSSVVMNVVTPLTLLVNISAVPGTTIHLGDNVSLTTTVINGSTTLTYQWVVNGIQIPGATTSSYSNSNFANGDSVSCMVTSDGFCNLAGAGWVIINITNVGVKSLNAESDLTILPNPNKGEFTIKGSLAGLSTDEEVSLEITDMLGQVVYRDKLTAHNGKLNDRIVLGKAVANGMYMLNLRSGMGNEVFHIVIEQ